MKIDPSSEAHAVTCRLLDGTSVDILVKSLVAEILTEHAGRSTKRSLYDR